MPILNMFLPITMTLETAIKNNLTKSQTFSNEISAVEFRYSQINVFGIHTNIAYNSETYDIVKLHPDSLKFDLSLDSSFFSLIATLLLLTSLT